MSRYIVVDNVTGCPFSTDNIFTAEMFSSDDSFTVVDTKLGVWMLVNGTTQPIDPKPPTEKLNVFPQD